jgi:tetratricopeptide (TPR) repeat protein
MKKFLSALVCALLISGLAQAQEDGVKLAKSAGKALVSFNQDPTGNKAKMAEAIEKIEQAMKTPEAQALASAWVTKGDIYNRRLDNDKTTRMLNPNAPMSGDKDALLAFEAYKTAYEMPTAKKYEKSDAVKGISGLQADLLNLGGTKYEAKDFAMAYQAYDAALKSHDVLVAAKEASAFDNPALYNDQMFYTAMMAVYAKDCKNAAPYLEKLTALDSVKAYEPLYNCKVEMGDEAGAEKLLAEGRKKFPEDSGLLFAEINTYLKKGQLDVLTDRLKQAIRQEPNNIGLYVTLGNVYDNLYQAMIKEKNDGKAKEYFDEAKTYYEQASAKDPKNVDAYYSIGALYYNKAAIRIQEMNALPDDFTSAGIKKMEAMGNEIKSLFDQALPYFQKAESISPNDVNTLIALSEIYARKEDELSIEFKKRLEKVRGGGKNDSAYFKQ